MKKIISILLVVTMTVAVFSGCSKQETTDESSNTEQQQTNDSVEEKEDTILRIAWWGSQSRHDKTIEVIKKYEEINPNVKIEPEFIGWNGYWEKLATQAAGGNLPDIVQMDMGYISDYVEKGLLADISQYTKDGTIDVSHVDESSLLAATFNEKLYGMSLGTASLSLMIDPAMFKEAGVDVFESGYTWDDLEKAATELHDKLGIYGTEEIGTTNLFPYYLRAHGQSMFNKGATDFAYDDQLFIDWMSMKLRLQDTGVMPTQDVSKEYSGEENSLFAHSKAPIGFFWSAKLIPITEVAGKEIELMILPGPNSKDGMFLKQSMFFSVSEGSKNKEEAAKFINFFTNNVDANMVLMGDRGVPVSSEIRNALKDELTPETRKVFEYTDTVVANSSPADEFPVGIHEINKLLTDIEEQVLFKQITAQEGAKIFREEGKAILDRIRN